MSPQFFTVQTHLLPCQYIREYPRATAQNQEDDLHLHIKQYTPLDKGDQVYGQSGAVTIIGAHANGFPKELYEPLWDELYERLRRSGVKIQGIWIADVAQEGQSSVLNEGKLGNEPSWFDHPRDLLYMINHFRKQMPRPLIGIGHSLGGNNLVNLSLMHPRLLTSLILIDPVIYLVSSPALSNNGPSYTQLSTFRRDRWPSRAHAATEFKSNEFYRHWDPRVFDLWAQYGLRDLPTLIYPDASNTTPGTKTSSEEEEETPVTLTTPKHQEVFTFLRPNFSGSPPTTSTPATINHATHPDLDPTVSDTFPFYRPEGPMTFKRLPHLRPSVLYIFAGKSPISPPEWRKAKLETTGIGVGGSGGAKEGRVKEVLFEDLNHLIPMEAVGRCADAMSGFLVPEMERWAKEKEAFERMWRANGVREKGMVDEEWVRRVGGSPRITKDTSKYKL